MKHTLNKTLIISILLAGLLVFTGKAHGQETHAKSVVLSEFYCIVMSDTSALILWTTESEQNSYQWRLERAVDSAGPYALRATLPAAGNSTMPTDYQYLDHPLHPDTLYYYRLAEVDLGGVTTYFGPITVCTGVAGGPGADISGSHKISISAAPNPFNHMTTIRYQITTPGWVELKIYDMAGRRVRTLVSGWRPTGRHEARWDGRDGEGERMPCGIFFIKLRQREKASNFKLLIIR